MAHTFEFRSARNDGTRSRKALARRKWTEARTGARLVPALEALEDRTMLSVLTVTSAADDGSAGTLRTVLTRAADGDTIEFAHSLEGDTISLVQGQLVVETSVQIDGPGASALAISGNSADRIFEISSGARVTVSGLSLTKGRATDGGAILNAGALSMVHDNLSGNVAQGVTGGGLFGDSAGRGGAIANQPGAVLTVTDSTFASNQALGAPNGGNAFGGALYNEVGTMNIARTTFIANQAVGAGGGYVGTSAAMGGGIAVTLLGVAAGGCAWNDSGAVTFAHCSFTNNQAQGGSNNDASASTAAFPLAGTAIGGAIGDGDFFSSALPDLSITDSRLTGNQSIGGSNIVVTGYLNDPGNGRGGAVGAMAGNVTVAGSVVCANQAESGALFTVLEGGRAILGAGATAFGGAIDDEFDFGLASPATPAELTLAESTISGNVALGNGPDAFSYGGGWASNQVNVQVTSCAVSHDQATGGSGGGFFTYFGRVEPLNGGLVQGGGISNRNGSLTITDSAVNDNRAQGGSGGTANVGSGFGGDSSGGGISFGGPSLVLENTTLSGNQSVAGDATAGSDFFAATGGGNSTGGALYMTGGAATVCASSFVDNLSQGGATRGYGYLGIYGSANGGGAAIRGGSLQVSDSLILGNQATGGTEAPGFDGGTFAFGGGGAATAGGIAFTGSSGSIDTTFFGGNLAQGGAGGAGAPASAGGSGGNASGGGLLTGSTLAVSNCTFVHDTARGGAGGPGGPGGGGGSGGIGTGGGLDATLDANVTIAKVVFLGDVAQGGAGGAGDIGRSGGAGGAGRGGGLAIGSASADASDCTLINNSAIGGAGGVGAPGGNGGAGQGGAIDITSPGGPATLVLTSALVSANAAQGGAGAAAAAGGDGEGGGIFVDAGSTVTVQSSLVTSNDARGGIAAGAGTAGEGVGGGAFILGVLYLDAGSSIVGNEASTSRDDVFGPVTPL
jgi:hypothetical protein